MGREGKNKKTSYRIFSWLLVIGCVLTFLGTAMLVYGYDAVEELSVTVGYWGGKEYTKKEVKLSELKKACGTYQEIYTWLDGNNNPGTIEAEGILIGDIMDYCGIDTGSVYYYNFYTVDSATYSNAMQQWTQDQLFGKRYTFKTSFQKAYEDYLEDKNDYARNPEAHYTIQDFFDFEKNTYANEAWSQREAAAPMLALKSKAAKWSGYTPPTKLDFSGMTDTGKPILLFGQAGKNDITRDLMAQMVNKVHIWFEGTPEITLEAPDLSDEIGSKTKTVVKVNTPDDYLSKSILDEIELVSSDPNVAEVDADGSIVIKGEGNAKISAIYNGTVYGSFSANGVAKGEDKQDSENEPKKEETKKEDKTETKQEEPKKQEPEKKPEPGDGTGEGTTQGEGTGSSTGANTGEGTGSGVQQNETGNNPASDANGTKNGTSARAESSQRRLATNGSVTRSYGTTSRPVYTAPDTAEETQAEIAETKDASDESAKASDDAQVPGVVMDKTGGAASGRGDNGEKIYEISEPDNVLTDSLAAHALFPVVLFAGILSLAIGAGGEIYYYQTQINWVKRAKRIYEKQ